MCCTDGHIGGHVVSVVKSDECQVGDVGGEGQDEQSPHHAGHTGPPQTQSPGQEGERYNVSKYTETTEIILTADIL